MSDSRNLITEVFVKKTKRPWHKSVNKSLPSPLRKIPKRKYIPGQGSAAYAILIALYKAEEDGKDCLSKEALKAAAQEFTATSMFTPLPGSFYTGFNSIKTLINNNLVERNKQRFASYFLTEEGRNVACKLYQIHCEKHQDNLNNYNNLLTSSEHDNDDDDDGTTSQYSSQITSQSSASASASASTSTSQRSAVSQYLDNYTLSPGSFDIVLCIDSREQTSGVNKEMRKTALLSALQQRGIKVEMRTLPVGDFAWIAQEKINFGNSITSNLTTNSFRFRKELILDFIIERKRIDDLASSIKDRRWEEQKYRLRNCGLRKPTYLIEQFGGHSKKPDYGGIKYDALVQATINAEIDGFIIKRCNSFDDTVRHLTLMTRYLDSFYKDRTIHSTTKEKLIKNDGITNNHFMTFHEFEKSATKITNFTVTEMFIKHLLQFRGISVQKAKIITDLYPTLQSLLHAYSILDKEKDKENLLSHLKCGLMERNFGPTLSKKIYKHYCMN